jgi:acyl-CoA thioester hydrolase
MEFRVRYADCDPMGYLHHARYWEYFEHVRTQLLRDNGFRYRDLEAQGVLFVVYKAECKYVLPIRYDDLAKVTATVTRITRTRVDHAYAASVEGRAACEASTTLACVGRDGRPRLMPDSLWATS